MSWVSAILKRAKAISMTKRIEIVIVVSLLLLSFFVLLQGIENSLWQDESYTVRTYIEQGPMEIISGDSYKPNNHILYSLVSWAAVSIFGFSEFILRILSVIPTIATLLVVFLITRRHYDRSTAITLLTLLTFGSFHIATTSSARGYGFMLLFSSLFLYFILSYVAAESRQRLSTKARRKKLLLASIFAFLTCYTLPSFIIFVACVFAVLIFNVKHKKDVAIAASSIVAITAIAFVPLIEGMIKYYVNFGGGFKKHQPVSWEAIYTFPVQKIGEILARFDQMIDAKLSSIVPRLDIEQFFMIAISIVLIFGIHYSMKNKKILSLLVLPPVLFLGLAASFSVPLANRTDYTLFLEFNYLIIFSVGIAGLCHVLIRHLQSFKHLKPYYPFLAAILILTLVSVGLFAKSKDISDQLIPRESHKAAVESVKDYYNNDSSYKIIYYGNSETSMYLYADKILQRNDTIVVNQFDNLKNILSRNRDTKIALITQLPKEDQTVEDIVDSSEKIFVSQKSRGVMTVYFLNSARTQGN